MGMTASATASCDSLPSCVVWFKLLLRLYILGYVMAVWSPDLHFCSPIVYHFLDPVTLGDRSTVFLCNVRKYQQCGVTSLKTESSTKQLRKPQILLCNTPFCCHSLFHSFSYASSCCLFVYCIYLYNGAHGSTAGLGTALQAGRLWVQFLMSSLELFIDIILPATLWPWGWLSL